MDFEVVIVKSKSMKPKGKMSMVKKSKHAGRPNDRVGKCSVCGEEAGVNTPCLNPDGELVCYRCADDSPVLMRGVDQFLDENGDYKPCGIYQKGEVHLWARHHDEVCCWLDNGSQAYPLTKDEKARAEANPEKFIDELLSRVRKGMARCSNCERDFKKKALKRGHFAAMLCPDCMKEYEEQIEEDRRTGNCCLMCGQPRSVCTC